MAGPLHAEENFAFMTCILRVNAKATGWQKAVSLALSNIRGVRNFKMFEDGKFEVSGTVDPNQLLKMLATKAGKKLVLCHWQFGECHSNLYLPEPKPEKPRKKEGSTNFNGYYGYDGGYYGCSPYYVNDWHLYPNGGYRDYPWPKYPCHALEAPPEEADGKGTVPGGDELPADQKSQAAENPPKSSKVTLKQCCSVM